MSDQACVVKDIGSGAEGIRQMEVLVGLPWYLKGSLTDPDCVFRTSY